MSQSIVAQPLGSTGNLSVVESAGVITLDCTEALLSGGVKAELKLDLSGAALLSAWSAATSNAELKAMLAEAATLVGALPA